MDDWLLYALILMALIAWLAPHLLGGTAYKLSLQALGAVLGYYADRSAFPYARPNDPAIICNDSRFAYAMQRRALIMASCIIGVSLGA
jgi:hypothetical protein